MHNMQINLFNQTTFTSQNITAVTCSFERKQTRSMLSNNISILPSLPWQDFLIPWGRFLEVNRLLPRFLLFGFLDKVWLLLSLLFTTVLCINAMFSCISLPSLFFSFGFQRGVILFLNFSVVQTCAQIDATCKSQSNFEITILRELRGDP